MQNYESSTKMSTTFRTSILLISCCPMQAETNSSFETFPSLSLSISANAVLATSFLAVMVGVLSFQNSIHVLINLFVSFFEIVPSLFTSKTRNILVRTSSGAPSDMMKKISMNSIKYRLSILGSHPCVVALNCWPKLSRVCLVVTGILDRGVFVYVSSFLFCCEWFAFQF
jgi:hypothetical protein